MDGVKTEDIELLLPDQTGSPSVDEDSNGGSSSGGGTQILKKGPWTASEDEILRDYVYKNGEGNWNAVQKNTGLNRCGKSCRLRWANHLRPDLKKGAFTEEEEEFIIKLHAKIGNKWAKMAMLLPGRTDNEIKNFWNTRRKRCERSGEPLYPSNIGHQFPVEDQHSASEFTYDEKPSNEFLQEISLPDIACDNLFATHNSSYAPTLPYFPTHSMIYQNFGSNNCVSAVEPTLRYGFPCHADQSINNSAPICGPISGSHALLNGDFSTSRPIPGPVKLELPSFQVVEADPHSWPDNTLAPDMPCPELVESFIQKSPLAATSAESECFSDRNSGLLDSVVHQAQSLSGGAKQPSISTSSSDIDPCHEYLQPNDTDSPDHTPSVSKLLDYCAMCSGSGATMAAGEYVQDLNDMLPPPKKLRPDTLLVPSCLDDENFAIIKELCYINDATVLFDDLCDDHDPRPPFSV